MVLVSFVSSSGLKKSRIHIQVTSGSDFSSARVYEQAHELEGHSVECIPPPRPPNPRNSNLIKHLCLDPHRRTSSLGEEHVGEVLFTCGVSSSSS